MEASAPPHDFALIPTDFRNIVLSGTRQAFESCGARRSLETCARIVRFVDPFLSQGRLIRSFLFLRDDFLTIDLVSRVDRHRSWVPPGQRAREINPVPSCPSLRRDTSCSPP